MIGNHEYDTLSTRLFKIQEKLGKKHEQPTNLKTSLFEMTTIWSLHYWVCLSILSLSSEFWTIKVFDGIIYMPPQHPFVVHFN